MFYFCHKALFWKKNSVSQKLLNIEWLTEFCLNEYLAVAGVFFIQDFHKLHATRLLEGPVDCQILTIQGLLINLCQDIMPTSIVIKFGEDWIIKAC